MKTYLRTKTLPSFALCLALFSLGLVDAHAAGKPPGAYSITKPKDAPMTRMVGALRIDTWNPVTMTPYEDNTHLFFKVTNTTSVPRSIEHKSFGNLFTDSSNMTRVTIHRLFGEAATSADAVIDIPAGGSKVLEFSLERFLTGKDTRSTIPFTFRSIEDNTTETIKLSVTTYEFNPSLEFKNTSYISGYVTDSAGRPIAGARVSAGLFAMTNLRSTLTNSSGRFRLGVLSMPDVLKLLGSRPLPYGELAYFVTVDKKGFSTEYRTIKGPNRGSTVSLNAKLRQIKQVDYSEIGSFSSDGTLAYWWVGFAGNRIIAVQGQHPPVSERSGHIVAIDLRGKEMWRQVTGGQCWGYDISADETLVAAGCDDGYVYVNRISDGGLLYKRRTGDRPGGSEVVAAEFSPDGRYLAVDGASGAGGFSVLNATTGDVLWTSSEFTNRTFSQAGYKIRWTSDSKRLLAGDNGLLSSFTVDGKFEWRQPIGYLPFFLETDEAGNVYTGTKDHMLYSFNPNGELRWRQTIASVPQMSIQALGASSKNLVMPAYSGLLQAYDFNGKQLWQHVMPFRSVEEYTKFWVPGIGHNAFMVTPDGKYMAIATRGYETTLFDQDGNLIWYHLAKARKDFKGDDPESHGHMTGGQAIAITPDAKYIAVGYADSVIRVFQKK